MEQVIVDTNVLIGMARGDIRLPDDLDIAMPAIVIAEFLTGVERSPSNRQGAQRAFLDDIVASLPVIDYDRTVAEHHAALLTFTADKGQQRGPHDLIIAATARATGRTLLTTDRRARFETLPEVRVRFPA